MDPFALLADLERGVLLRFERGQLQIIKRPRIEPAAPESGRGGGVDHEVRRPLIVESGLPVEVRVVRSGLDTAQIQYRVRNVDERIVLIETVILVLLLIPNAVREY